MIFMRKTFKYRIYPTNKQERELNTRLESCRKLYNKLLGQRKDSWEQHQKGISYYDQQNQLPLLKAQCPNFKYVYSNVLQDVVG